MRLAVAVLALLSLAGCSDWQGGEQVQVDGYQVRVKTDPDPLQVGETATLVLLLRDAAGREATACRARFRRYMPGMEMSEDNHYLALEETGPGRYLGRSGQFRMGGDWVLEFRFDCGNGEHSFLLKRHLAWRE